LELGPTVPSMTWLLRACLVHGGSGYLTSWLTRASGLANGRLGLGGITRYRVAALTGHGLPNAELACGASACTPDYPALRRQYRPVTACAVPAQESAQCMESEPRC
jgi:hypothetical protein